MCSTKPWNPILLFAKSFSEIYIIFRVCLLIDLYISLVRQNANGQQTSIWNMLSLCMCFTSYSNNIQHPQTALQTYIAWKQFEEFAKLSSLRQWTKSIKLVRVVFGSIWARFVCVCIHWIALTALMLPKVIS